MSIHRLFTRLIPLAVAAALVPAATASAASLPAGTTAIVSGAPSLTDALPAAVGFSSTTSESVSQNGRYVAFASNSDGLVDGDDDRMQNVYVKDRATGAVIQVNKRSGANGDPANASCEDPAINDDGTRVAFTCEGPLDDADDNRTDDVYVRDLGSQATILVSRVSNLGAVGESRSDQPSISANGEYVAFTSDASRNLHPDAANGGQLVFRRHIGGGNETIVVSKSEAANGGTAFIGKEPSISDDGQKVAFTSFPVFPKAHPDDSNAVSDVFVRDIPNDKLLLASREPLAGAAGNDHSDSPALAGDGSAVAFRSQANNLVNSQDQDHEQDVYWRSLTGPVNQQNTALVSINAAGTRSHASAPSIDDSGQLVGFLADQPLDTADTNSNVDAYLRDLSVANTLQLLSRADGDNGAPAGGESRSVAISGDGTKAAVGTVNGRLIPGAEPHRGTVMLRDLAAGPRRTYLVARPAGDDPFLNQGGFAGGSSISADGRFIAFVTDAAALGVPDAIGTGIVVRDRVTGGLTLASRADGPNGAPLPENGQTPSISADGRRIAFAVREGPDRGIWVRDIVDNRTFLASRADGANGAPADAASNTPKLDADGSRVAFVTAATNLGDGDTDATLDVHLRDLETNQTQLVSKADGLNGAKGNGQSSAVDLSADGFKAAFVSAASNLGDGDTDTQTDVHLRDLSAQTTRLVSTAQGGTPSNGPDFYVSIDASGNKVGFASTAPNLGVPPQTSQVFVRDLAADTPVLASRADGADGAPSNKNIQNAVISPDGGYVAFTSNADNLAPGLPPISQAYRRDLAGGRTDPVSRRTSGEPAQRGVVNAEDISAGGGCVSFRANDAFYGPQTDYVHSYLRVLRDDCAAGAGPDGSGAGGGGQGPGGGAADKTAPVLSKAKLSRKRFSVGRKATPVAAAAKQGTVLSFRSSEAGKLRITFERALPKKRFRRAGTVDRAIKAGAGKVALTGRLGRKAMAAGKYRATLVATDAAGNRSKPVVVKFTIVKGR